MEVIINNYWLFFVIMAAALAFGFIFGRISKRNKEDGIIFIEMTEDRERERVRFVLGMGLDEIKKKSQLVFKVNNTESQNSQSI